VKGGPKNSKDKKGVSGPASPPEKGEKTFGGGKKEKRVRSYQLDPRRQSEGEKKEKIKKAKYYFVPQRKKGFGGRY